MEEEKEFRVIDRRSSAAGDHKPEAERREAAGEGFVMKEPKAAAEAAPSQIDLSTLLLSLATGAMIHLGLAPDPVTKKTQKNIEMARQNIEILNLLEQKTKGNLSDEESRLLESLLTETRLRFVEANR